MKLLDTIVDYAVVIGFIIYDEKSKQNEQIADYKLLQNFITACDEKLQLAQQNCAVCGQDPKCTTCDKNCHLYSIKQEIDDLKTQKRNFETEKKALEQCKCHRCYGK